MSETWFAPICAYCERGDATFWAEPLNALSNGAFLVAAIAAGWQAWGGVRRDGAALTLAIPIGIVGLGSFLFHTLAVRWSMLADVIPIALFIHAYFFLALRRYLGLGGLAAAGVTLLFSAFNAGLEPALDAVTGRSLGTFTNGSIGYAPAFLALVGIAMSLLQPQGCALGPARNRAGRALLAIAALFAVSLTLRTLDARLCASVPMGTHFLWHLLNAGVLYGLVAIAVRYRARAP